jgi:hypothetical protein
VDKAIMVTRLVDQWYAPSRDNYLAAFHRFALFMAMRILPTCAPFEFKENYLLAFVNMLLLPTGRGRQLKIATVEDQLS